jgi:hypothetical protein
MILLRQIELKYEHVRILIAAARDNARLRAVAALVFEILFLLLLHGTVLLNVDACCGIEIMNTRRRCFI